jgi:methionyl-tRNA synthetase
MELAGAANGFVETRAPWAQAKDPARAAELDATLASLSRALVTLATVLEPFMPARMPELAKRFGFERLPLLDELAAIDPAGRRVVLGEVLFPKDRE